MWNMLNMFLEGTKHDSLYSDPRISINGNVKGIGCERLIEIEPHCKVTFQPAPATTEDNGQFLVSLIIIIFFEDRPSLSLKRKR